jgi:integrase/recombinase XerD
MKKKFIQERGVGSLVKEGDRRTKKSRRSSTQESEYTVDEALEVFIQAKEAEGVRERTVHDYRQHIHYLKEFMRESDSTIHHINELTSQIIRQYILYMKDERTPYEGVEGRESKRKGLSITTINIRLRTLRTMCKLWYAEEIIDSNPMESIKSVKDDKKEEVSGLSDEEIDCILNSLNERYYAEWRDKVLILLLLDTGMRINEAVSMKVEQVDFKNCSILIPSENAKNRKYREVPLSRGVAKLLKELQKETETYFDYVDNVFYNAYGEPLTSDAFRRRLNRLKNKLGLKKLHPHMFRHTFCRKYILNGGDIFTLQKIVDHADIQTTRRYIQMDAEHIKQQHNRHSPVRKFMKRYK